MNLTIPSSVSYDIAKQPSSAPNNTIYTQYKESLIQLSSKTAEAAKEIFKACTNPHLYYVQYKFRQFGKELSFTELTKSLKEEPQWQLLRDDIDKRMRSFSLICGVNYYHKMLVEIFGNTAIKAKFDQEFSGKSLEEILEKLGPCAKYFSPVCSWLPQPTPPICTGLEV